MLTLSAISLIETPSDFSKMILMLQDEKGNFHIFSYIFGCINSCIFSLLFWVY